MKFPAFKMTKRLFSDSELRPLSTWKFSPLADWPNCIQSAIKIDKHKSTTWFQPSFERNFGELEADIHFTGSRGLPNRDTDPRRGWSSVLWVHDMLVWIRIRTTDLRIWLRSPDPNFSLVPDKMATKKKIFFFLSSFWRITVEGTFTSVLNFHR